MDTMGGKVGPYIRSLIGINENRIVFVQNNSNFVIPNWWLQ